MLSVAVIGLGRFGRAVTYSLVKLGAEVLAIDKDQTAIQEIDDSVARAVTLDATDKRALSSIPIERMSATVVALGEPMEASVFVTGILSEMGIKNIVARARRPLHARILRKVGAHRVVYLEQEMGEHIAKSLMGTHVVDWFRVAEGLDVAHLVVGPPIAGRSLGELHFRKNYKLMVVGHEKKGSAQQHLPGSPGVMSLPDPDQPLENGDHIAVAGSAEAILRLQQLMKDPRQ